MSEARTLRKDSGGRANAWALVLAFVGLGFATSPASAQVTTDNTSTATTTAASININHATSGSDRLMLVGVSIAQSTTETVSSIGRSSRPRAHMKVAGMFRCPCVRSIPVYVPSAWSP